MNLTVSINNRTVDFQLQDGKKTINVNEWDKHQISGCNHLLVWLNASDETNRIDEYTLSVDMKRISDVPNELSSALNLPDQITPLLFIRQEGVIGRDNFKLIYEWHKNSGGRKIAAAEKIGCFLKVGNKYFRLPKEIYEITEAIDEINRTQSKDISEVLLSLYKIEHFLPEDTITSIKTDGFLNSTKVYFANALELDVYPTSSGYDFDPILQNHELVEDYFTDNISSEFKKVLPNNDHKIFVQKFRKYTECKSNYSLGDGKYLVISKYLKQALTTVKNMQASTEAIKMEFLKNPKAVLSQDGVCDELLDRVFSRIIFSDRVKGIGERIPKVIPWVKIEGQDWFPSEESHIGLKIGDKSLTLSEDDCNQLTELINTAKSEGKESVSFKGVDVPATTDTLNSISGLVALKPTHKNKVEPHSAIADDVKLEKPEQKPYVLYIKENLDDVQYQPKFQPRPNITVFTNEPTILRRKLYKHQVEGVKWLVDSYAAGLSGVLLADDMGLGKSFQALAFLAWYKDNIENNNIQKKPILLVAPAGLLDNWKDEHDKHLHEPGIGELVCAYGKHLKSLRLKGSSKQLVKPLSTAKLKNADWILTTYETLSNHQASFASVYFGVTIFDEMQKIKTPGTGITEAAQALHTDFIIGLTGTPIENRLADLWCLVDTLQPGKLGSLKEFSEKYEKDQSIEKAEELKQLLMKPCDGIPPLLFRRMKEECLGDIPTIEHHKIEYQMPAMQTNTYSQVLKDRHGTELNDGKQLESLHKLRAVSLHPITYSSDCDDESFIVQSARLKATFEILDKIHKKNEKALIFIEFQKWHQTECLPAMIKRRYNLKRIPMVISGAINSKARQDMVRAFEDETDEFDVMLLSPRAGGVGLTLTSANHVIHLSRWWNPAVEDQCTDRSYRIGQKKPVNVYYPIAIHPSLGENSFDAALDSLLDQKRSLSRLLLVAPSSKDNVSKLYSSTFETDRGVSKKKPTITINDLNLLEPTAFESWVINQCKKAKLVAYGTQKSWDGGADIIIRSPYGKTIAIVQVKHTQSNEATHEAIDDLMRAVKAYDAPQARLIAVTNAKTFSKRAIKLASSKGNIKLVCSDKLLDIANQIKSFVGE